MSRVGHLLVVGKEAVSVTDGKSPTGAGRIKRLHVQLSATLASLGRVGKCLCNERRTNQEFSETSDTWTRFLPFTVNRVTPDSQLLDKRYALRKPTMLPLRVYTRVRF
jgi:hypothetical protein